MIFWSYGLRKLRHKLKFFIRYHSGYGHQNWKICSFPWRAPKYIIIWTFNHVVLLDQATKQNHCLLYLLLIKSSVIKCILFYHMTFHVQYETFHVTVFSIIRLFGKKNEVHSNINYLFNLLTPQIELYYKAKFLIKVITKIFIFSWIFERIWEAKNPRGMFAKIFQITLLHLLTLCLTLFIKRNLRNHL